MHSKGWLSAQGDKGTYLPANSKRCVNMSEDNNTDNSKQHDFIDQFIERGTQVSVFLRSGIQLCGIVMEVDKYVIILESNESTQLIYKHAIASIQEASYDV